MVASAFVVAKIERSAQARGVRIYYQVLATDGDHASVTALIGVDLSARAVDFDGLAWCNGAVLFEVIGSFLLDATPIPRRLETELAQRLRTYLACKRVADLEETSAGPTELSPPGAAGVPRPGSPHDGGSRRRRR